MFENLFIYLLVFWAGWISAIASLVTLARYFFRAKLVKISMIEKWKAAEN